MKGQKFIELTWEEWEEKYKLIENPTIKGYVFDNPSGMEFLRTLNPLQIWTACDGENGVFICSGKYVCNRLCNYATEVPYREDEYIEVEYYTEKEKQDMEECNEE